MQEVTRIRYKKQTDGTLHSKTFVAPNAEVYYAIVKPDTKSFEIVRVSPGLPERAIITGAGANLSLIKKEVKRNLKELGITFLDEDRKTKHDPNGESKGEGNV